VSTHPHYHKGFITPTIPFECTPTHGGINEYSYSVKTGRWYGRTGRKLLAAQSDNRQPMTTTHDKLRSLFLAALMVFSVFAMTVAIPGSLLRQTSTTVGPTNGSTPDRRIGRARKSGSTLTTQIMQEPPIRSANLRVRTVSAASRKSSRSRMTAPPRSTPRTSTVITSSSTKVATRSNSTTRVSLKVLPLRIRCDFRSGR